MIESELELPFWRRYWPFAPLSVQLTLVKRRGTDPVWSATTSEFAPAIVIDGRHISVGWPGRIEYRYLIDERVLEVWCRPELGPDHVSMSLSGMVAASIGVESGRIPLHGATIVWRNGAYLVLAESGTGKSTLVAHWLSRGATLVADDLSMLSLGQPLTVDVDLGLEYVRLWPDAGDLLALPVDTYPKALCQHEKRVVWHESWKSHQGPTAALRGIFWLRGNHVGRMCTLDHRILDKRQAAAALHLNMFARRAMSAAQSGRLFAACAEIACKVPVIEIAYSKAPESLPIVVSMMEELMNTRVPQ